MSQFKHALAARDAHIMTLRLVIGLMLLVSIALWYGWQSAPRHLTIHNPPIYELVVPVRGGKSRPDRFMPSVFISFSKLTAGQLMVRKTTRVISMR